MKRILIAVDLQNDFISGALGTAEAEAIVPRAAEKLRAFDGDALFVTLDTHGADYLQTLEGQKLPVVHCVEGTHGHALCDEVREALKGKAYTEIRKNGFGSFDIAPLLCRMFPDEEIGLELIGLCTDICVVTNALILRAAFPNAEIAVDARCCAGVTPETHRAALDTMRCCQIDVTE